MKTEDIQQVTLEAGEGTQLTEEQKKYFSGVTSKVISEQATIFLNLFWTEFQNQAEFIFTASYKEFIQADMKQKKIVYHHLYKEGQELDFNLALYFYEQLCKNVENNKLDEKFKASFPVMMTALKRKAFLKVVDINFDGKISFLEYLLDQYKISIVDFCKRRKIQLEGNPNFKESEEYKKVKQELEKAKKSLDEAKKSLEDVNQKINEFEAEKLKLTEGAKQEGVKGLRMKNQLAQLDNSPLKEKLNVALIKTNSLLRAVTKTYQVLQKKLAQIPQGEVVQEFVISEDGAIWWMNRDLTDKKAKYGKQNEKKIVKK